MKEYLSKWTIPRIIQLVVGIFFLWDYFTDHGSLALAFGTMMFAQAALNIGCFSSKGCSTNPSYDEKDLSAVSNEMEVEYEEVA